MEPHDIGRQHQTALVAVVKDRVVRKEVLNDVVTGLKLDAAGDLASFSSVCVFLRVEKREEVELPGDNTALLDNVLHVLKLDAIVRIRPVHLELFLSFEGLATLWARHFESCLKLHILVLVDFLLLCMVLTIPLLLDLVLYGLAVLLQKLLAHEALRASFALVATLALDLIVRAQTRGALSIVHRGILAQSSNLVPALLDDSIDLAFAIGRARLRLALVLLLTGLLLLVLGHL